jgi:hypothetical protein
MSGICYVEVHSLVYVCILSKNRNPLNRAHRVSMLLHGLISPFSAYLVSISEMILFHIKQLLQN